LFIINNYNEKKKIGFLNEGEKIWKKKEVSYGQNLLIALFVDG